MKTFIEKINDQLKNDSSEDVPYNVRGISLGSNFDDGHEPTDEDIELVAKEIKESLERLIQEFENGTLEEVTFDD